MRSGSRERCVGNKHTKLEENTQNRFVPLSKEAQVNSKKETNKGLSVQATNMVKVFQNKVQNYIPGNKTSNHKIKVPISVTKMVVFKPMSRQVVLDDKRHQGNRGDKVNEKIIIPQHEFSEQQVRCGFLHGRSNIICSSSRGEEEGVWCRTREESLRKKELGALSLELSNNLSYGCIKRCNSKFWLIKDVQEAKRLYNIGRQLGVTFWGKEEGIIHNMIEMEKEG